MERCRTLFSCFNYLRPAPLLSGKSHSKRLKMTQREAEELVKKAADSQIPEDEPPVVAPSMLIKFDQCRHFVDFEFFKKL